MKKIASILILIFAFSLTAEAQRKRRKEKGPQLSIEQRSTLMAKQMTLSLDLSDKQQKQIKSLFKTQAAEKMSAMKIKKENRANKKKPTADEIYAMKNKVLDNRIAFKKGMKNILTAEQFEKFQKMAKVKKMKGKKMMKKKMARKKKMMMMKKRKMEKKRKEEKGNN